ncbi:MFS transporter [Saccharopolyspora sp. NPDC049426]|uniref:MFS transporter n=1 Tax=Saccharopolyspora sp. NPDC049426 TaxID=3155652 RepID=UPI0034341DF7
MTRGVRSGLGSRSFRCLLAAWAVSSVGDGVLSAALPLVTAVITRDPLAMSGVALATVLPWLLVALPAGAIVDRFPVRRMLVVSHLFRSAVALCLAVVIATGAPATAAERSSLRSEVVAGLRFLMRQPALRAVVGVVGVTALLTSGVNAVAFLYAIEVVRLPAASVPTLLVCTAIGTLLAAPAASRWAARWGSGTVMISALLVLAAGIALLEAAADPLLIWVAYFVMGVGAGAWNVLSAANRQRLTPRALTGRVTSAHRVLAWGLMPLGAGLAGPIAEVSSLQAVILGAAVVLIAVVAVAAPRLRRLPGAE